MAEVLALRALDTPPEPEFDGIARAAAAVCETPTVLVSLIDDERQWYKATLGFDQSEMPRDEVICAHTISDPSQPLILPDAMTHANFSLNPLVGPDGVRFYAGWPLVTRSGKAIGSLCVVDTKPREGLSETQIAAMTGLAEAAARLFEAHRHRLELSEAFEQQDRDFAKLVASAASASHQASSTSQAVSEVLDSLVGILWAESAEYWVRSRRGFRRSRLWAGDAFTVLHHRDCARYRADAPLIVHHAAVAGRTVSAHDERGFDVFAVPIADAAGTAGVITVHLGRRVEPSVTRLRNALEQVGMHLTRTVERQRQARDLAWRSEHDPVTTLPNRSHMTRMLDKVFEHRREGSVALAFIDLNQFKLINDSLGHAAGDELLLLAARRMHAAVRQGDLLARFGGDEFVLLCRRVRRTEDATARVEAVLNALREPFTIHDQEVFLSASAGVALGASSTTASGLLADGDAAMYAAKRRRTGLEMSNPAERASARSSLDIHAGLQRALQDGSLDVAYQPIVRTADRGVAFFEALARWHRPGHGPVSPAEFIPVAEETGMIGRLDDYVRGQALAQLRRWDEMGAPLAGSAVSVNVSLRDLREGFAWRIAEQLRSSGVAESRLILEVTESAVLYGQDEAVAQLQQLREIGCHIAIDDFGTGYSSLRRLRELPASYLKLAGGLLADAPSDEPFLRGVVALAESLGQSLVVEGVEDGDQLDALRSARAPLAQGFHLLRPSPPDVIEAWMFYRATTFA